MYAVIVSPKFWNDIDQVIHSTGEEILYQEIDKEIDLAAELEKISRIAVKYLIIDISAIADQNKIPQDIMNYRLKREGTRIIIIAPNCLPGNPLLSNLFSIGVWDFINPKLEKDETSSIAEALRECISREASYAKGVKWYIGTQDNLSEQSNVSRKNASQRNSAERTVIIEKEQIIGTVIIAIAGTMKRIGTTHTAISIGTYLKELNHNVAIAELHMSNNFEAIKSSYEDVKDWGNMFTLCGIDFYPYSPNLKVSDLLEAEYDYLILDIGQYDEENLIIDEFKRANVRIIVSGSKDWELTALESILRTGEKIYKNKYYFTFTSNDAFKMVVSNMDKLQCYQAQYSPDPFFNSSECKIVFSNMLKEVLPSIRKSKTGNVILDLLNKLLPRSKGNEA